MNRASETVADITYRANAIDGREIVVRLQRTPEAATLADAWARLVAIEPNVDPMSIEIEVREAAPTRRHVGENLRKDHEARGIGARWYGAADCANTQIDAQPSSASPAC
jgi:hypothetical protein